MEDIKQELPTKKSGSFFVKKNMTNPEIIITENIRPGLNSRIDKMQSGIDPVVQALTLGNVYDKDEAAKKLGWMEKLYRDIGVEKHQAKEFVKGFEDRVYGGTREEQIKAAKELETASDGLNMAIQKANETKKDEA